MVDSKLKSLSEVFSNLIIGFIINYGANFLIVPFYATRIAQDVIAKNFNDLAAVFGEMGIWYTIVSVMRMWALRRVFNKFGKNENLFTLSKRLYRKIKVVLKWN